MQTQIFATTALLPSGWARNVSLTIDAAGRIASITPNTVAKRRKDVRPYIAIYTLYVVKFGKIFEKR